MHLVLTAVKRTNAKVQMKNVPFQKEITNKLGEISKKAEKRQSRYSKFRSSQ